MDDLEGGYDMLVGNRHGFSVTLSDPSDIIIVHLDGRKYKVDIVDYLDKKHLDELANSYNLVADNHEELIRLLRLRIRGIKEKRKESLYCEISMFFIILILLMAIAILIGLVAYLSY